MWIIQRDHCDCGWLWLVWIWEQKWQSSHADHRNHIIWQLHNIHIEGPATVLSNCEIGNRLLLWWVCGWLHGSGCPDNRILAAELSSKQNCRTGLAEAKSATIQQLTGALYNMETHSLGKNRLQRLSNHKHKSLGHVIKCCLHCIMSMGYMNKDRIGTFPVFLEAVFLILFVWVSKV